jgi:hypothetical protein
MGHSTYFTWVKGIFVISDTPRQRNLTETCGPTYVLALSCVHSTTNSVNGLFLASVRSMTIPVRTARAIPSRDPPQTIMMRILKDVLCRETSGLIRGNRGISHRA